jgi:hypothetical protein
MKFCKLRENTRVDGIRSDVVELGRVAAQYSWWWNSRQKWLISLLVKAFYHRFGYFDIANGDRAVE